MRRVTAVGSIRQVGYRPPAAYGLDLEVLSFSEMRRRAGAVHFQEPHRIAFHVLICVTRGACAHVIDFKSIQCRRGTLLTLRPSQTQQFDIERNWDAAVVIFRPEFLLPLRTMAAVSDIRLVGSLEQLPEHLQLSEGEFVAVTEAIARMRQDSSAAGHSAEVHALLRHQLYALLLRIHLAHGRHDTERGVAPSNAERFRRFQELLARRFVTHRQVADYASQLGCSEKTLNRAALESSGQTAKAYIASRVNLEAKRLLVHTALQVGAIAEQLGFDEATNFVKFFKREVGCTPGEFRARHTSRVD